MSHNGPLAASVAGVVTGPRPYYAAMKNCQHRRPVSHPAVKAPSAIPSSRPKRRVTFKLLPIGMRTRLWILVKDACDNFFCHGFWRGEKKIIYHCVPTVPHLAGAGTKLKPAALLQSFPEGRDDLLILSC